jgi:hypothetical protein
MRYLYSAILGLALGVSSVFVYGMYPPIGLLLSIAATCLGTWAVGRLWGKRIYRFIAAAAWGFVTLRAGFPGVNNEYLLEGTTLGFSLINFGFIAVVIAILTPL